MWKQASVVLALAALCSANMDRMANMAMQQQVANYIMEQISGNIYDRMSNNAQDRRSNLIVDRISNNIYDRMTGELLGNLKDFVSEKVDDESHDLSFEELCRCRPGEPDEDFTMAQLEAWINKVGDLEEFLEENGYPATEGFDAVIWKMKYANAIFDEMAEYLSENQNALKAAALSCAASGDIDIEKIREALDTNVCGGIAELDFDSEQQWTKEEFQFKLLAMKFKSLIYTLKKNRYGFVALNGCRESRTFDGKEIMKALAVSEQELVGLNATARVTFMYNRLEQAANKAAAFVYAHRSVFKIPDYCLEVAAKGKMLSAISEKVAANFRN